MAIALAILFWLLLMFGLGWGAYRVLRNFPKPLLFAVIIAIPISVSLGLYYYAAGIYYYAAGIRERRELPRSSKAALPDKTAASSIRPYTLPRVTVPEAQSPAPSLPPPQVTVPEAQSPNSSLLPPHVTVPEAPSPLPPLPPDLTLGCCPNVNERPLLLDKLTPAVLIRSQLIETVPGLVVFNPPTEMTVGVAEQITVRISRGVAETTVKAKLQGRGVAQVEEVKVGTFMRPASTGMDFRSPPKVMKARLFPITALQNGYTM